MLRWSKRSSKCCNSAAFLEEKGIADLRHTLTDSDRSEFVQQAKDEYETSAKQKALQERDMQIHIELEHPPQAEGKLKRPRARADMQPVAPALAGRGRPHQHYESCRAQDALISASGNRPLNN